MSWLTYPSQMTHQTRNLLKNYKRVINYQTKKAIKLNPRIYSKIYSNKLTMILIIVAVEVWEMRKKNKLIVSGN